MYDFRTTHPVNECGDVVWVSDAEWEFDSDTGCSRLIVVETRPARCSFTRENLGFILETRASLCQSKEDFLDPCPF